MNFISFLCAVPGGNLTAQYLLSQGFRPQIDFGHHYGLRGLLVGQIWFGIFGTTPVLDLEPRIGERQQTYSLRIFVA